MRVSFLVILVLIPGILFPQTFGSIFGVLQQENNSPLFTDYTVILSEWNLQTRPNENGQFRFQDLTARSYRLELRLPAGNTITLPDIPVSAGRITLLQIQFPTDSQHPEVRYYFTDPYTVYTIFSDEIDQSPLRGLDAYLENQPGVIYQDGQIHVRGGRTDETAFYLNGLSTLNPLNRQNSVTLIPEAIQEVQAQTGGYSARWGGAASGQILTELKTGGKDFRFRMDFQTDKFTEPGKKFLDTYSYRDHYWITQLSGPLFRPNLRYFVAVENENIGDAAKRFSKGFTYRNLPIVVSHTWEPDTLELLQYPDGFTPHNNRNRWSVNSTLHWDTPRFKLHLTGIYNREKIYQNITPMLNILNNRDQYWRRDQILLSGLFRHRLSPHTYYQLQLGYFRNFQELNDDYFGNEWRAWADSARVAEATNGEVILPRRHSPGQTYHFEAFYFYANGYLNNPDYSKMERNYYTLAIQFNHRISRNHLLQAGFSLEQHKIRQFRIYANLFQVMDFGGWESEDEIPEDVWNRFIGPQNFGYDRFGNKIEDGFDGPKKPFFAAAYLEDRFRFSHLDFTLGFRFDHFDLNDWTLVNPFYPRLDRRGYIAVDQFTENKSYNYLSPRLGVKKRFPSGLEISTFAGRFVQPVPLDYIYWNRIAYFTRILIPLQDVPFLSPIGFDLKPISSWNFELHFRHTFSPGFRLEINSFYRQTGDQVDVIAHPYTPPNADSSEYKLLANYDKSRNYGLEFSAFAHITPRLSSRLQYTFMVNEGTGSHPTSHLREVYYGLPLPGDYAPLDFSHGHSGLIDLTYRVGKEEKNFLLRKSLVDLLFTFSSGHPFTLVYPQLNTRTFYGAGVEYMVDFRRAKPLEPTNTSRTPWIYRLDLRIEKSFSLTQQVEGAIFVRVVNLLNTRNKVNVYTATGNTENDGLITRPDFREYWEKNVSPTGFDLYRRMNLENGQSYWHYLGKQLWDHPRQILVGIRLNY